MTNKEITNAIAELYRTTSTLEELYIENGGEITEETAEKEDQLEAIKAQEAVNAQIFRHAHDVESELEHELEEIEHPQHDHHKGE